MARIDRMFDDTGVKKAEPHPKRETKWLHYTKLVDHQAQYCNEKSRSEIETLAGLIDADKGVLQNLLVRKIDTDEYEIIAGHKRCRACKWLVEEDGKKQYEFLPCTVENLSDVQAEFQLYSSNRFHEKNDYERMHELERMKYLLETYPEEFPHLQTGRMVERLAKQMGIKRSTVGEYLNISNNLGEKGKEEFRKGNLKKSAAVELCSLPEKEQEKLIEQGITSHKEIKALKENRKKDANEQLTGQYKVVNTEMDMEEEDVPKSGTQSTKPDTVDDEEENVPKFGTQTTKPDIVDDEEEDVPKSGTQSTEPDTVDGEEEDVPKSGTQSTEAVMASKLPEMKNSDQRRKWLRNYKEWGIWYKDDHIGAVYYKYDFPDGTRLIAETYPDDYTMAFMHLVGGPKERETNQYGIPKYPYHKRYQRHPDSETELIEFLKAVQKK